MKPARLSALWSAALFGLLAAAGVSSAAVRYVNLNNPSPASPYDTWEAAAQVIQEAVDAADPGTK
jgi:hypothetical protein